MFEMFDFRCVFKLIWNLCELNEVSCPGCIFLISLFIIGFVTGFFINAWVFGSAYV